MPELSTVLRVTIVALSITTSFAAAAQGYSATAKKFKRYPTGEWQQELVGYREGKALGPPVVSKTCNSPTAVKAMPAIPGMPASASQQCSTRTLVDEERLWEFETVCKVGSGVQTIHSTLRAVDDRTLMEETRSSLPPLPDTVMKSKVTYLGACSAATVEAQQKPSAADCADVAKMRADLEASKSGPDPCAQLPGPARAQCEASMAAAPKFIASLEQMCR